MNIHEYQAKQILSKFNVPIPKGLVADSAEAAQSSANELGGDLWVVKAQIHSGARGKAGGIIVCKNEQDVSDATNKLLGKTLVTHQTGPEGKTVHKVYIEEGTDIKKEFYLGLVFDRSSESIMVIASSEGGMSIEEIAEEKPESIVKTKVEAAVGLQAFQAREIAFGLGLEGKAVSRCAQAILGTYQAFCSSEATMAEINPLVLTGDDEILALDCKMTIDDNALFRNSNLLELKDETQEDPKETYAAEQGLNYIPLDGDIGNIINGAGLAMASMDMIQLAGGQPANSLDVGGGATLEIFVKVLLINIFAGINRCDWVAQGIVDALEQINIEQPLVIRLAGTNVDEGIKILKDSKIEYIEASTLEDAANKAVKAQKDLENK